MNPLASPGPSAQAGHVGLCCALVDEDEAGWIKTALRSAPFLAGFEDIGAILFAGAESLFLYVSSIEAKA